MHRGRLLYGWYFTYLLTDGTPENYIMGELVRFLFGWFWKKLMIDRY